MLTSFIGDTLKSAAIATAATSATAAAFGLKEVHCGAAPFNATSHILWGDKKAKRNGPSLKYTATGAALNAGAMLLWAGVNRLLTSKTRPSIGRALVGGAVTAGLAYLLDYKLLPKRFTPGFELRLSKRALATIFGVLGASLAAGAMTRSRGKRQ